MEYIAISNCACGGFPEVKVTEPCDDYLYNATYKYKAYIECTNCDMSVTHVERFKTQSEAIQNSTIIWNKHPIIARANDI